MERLVPTAKDSAPTDPDRRTVELSPAEIERRVHAADHSILFVEPRILRRVIMQDRRMTGLGIHVPHSHVYTIDRERLLIIVDRHELDLSPAAELPPHVVLIPRPTENEHYARLDSAERLHFLWRLAFHGRIHATLDAACDSESLSLREVTDRMQQIGEAEWSEIRLVLQQDQVLLPPAGDLEVYCEFVSVALELKYFAAADRPFFFPGIRDWDLIDQLISEEVPHEKLYTSTKPVGAADTLQTDPTDGEDLAGKILEVGAPDHPPPPQYWQWLTEADSAARRGNRVKAAILRMQAAEVAGGVKRTEASEAAEMELRRLVDRLQSLWRLSGERAETWYLALLPLLKHIGQGYHSYEARLLYDLQKACIAHERGVYRIDLVAWVMTLGREPLRRDLPVLRSVLSVKHLRTASRRVRLLQVSPKARHELRGLLEGELHRSEIRVREDLGPQIDRCLEEVGLTPENVPEQIARQKIVAEILDSIVERGFAGMGDLRDAISRNDLKLRDVSGILEPLLGDKLLRADTRLARTLDGVYRKGPVYLRWPQRLSSLAFGTKTGRFLTEFVVLPFGISFVALEAIKHIVHMFTDAPVPPGPPIPVIPPPPVLPPEVPVEAAAAAVDAAGSVADGAGAALQDGSPLADAAGALADRMNATLHHASGAATDLVTQTAAHHHPPSGPGFYAAVIALGVLILLFQQNERFHDRVLNVFKAAWKGLKWLCFDLPNEVIQHPVVQAVLRSQLYRVFRNYLLRPAIATAIFTGLAMVGGFDWSARTQFEVFLGVNLFLNSGIGRYFEEWLTDLFVRAWHELRMRVFAATFYWIMDLFHRMMRGLEQVIYVVDEWLRFRSGDPRRFILVKAFLGLIWGIVSYVIRIYVTLLIEPQINPVKHFPVVTVTHKLILPLYPAMTHFLVERLKPFMGFYLANLFSVANLFLLPGVFGFLVWELKGNWLLYAANRPPKLHPLRIGHHGETVVGLLRPGFHSGTLPKLFTKLRTELHVVGDRNHDRNVERYRDGIEAIEVTVRRFVDRTFCAILQKEGGATFAEIQAGPIELATNRIAVAFVLKAGDDRDPLWIEFEDLGSWLCARVVDAGWMTSLAGDDRERLNVAVAGLYKLAGVEIVHEHLDPVLSGVTNWKQFSPGGLVIHGRERFEETARYPLLSEEEVLLPQPLDGEEFSDQDGHGAGRTSWPILSRREALFEKAEIPWEGWVKTWSNSHDHIEFHGLPRVLPNTNNKT